MNHCFYHSSQPAEYHCWHCQKDVCRNCIIVVDGEPVCQVCWEGFIAKNQAEFLKETPAPVKSSIPWQDRSRLGWIQAFFQTFQLIAFHPGRFFSKMPIQSNYSTPLYFAVLCLLIFQVPMYVFQLKVVLPYSANNLLTLDDSSKMDESMRQKYEELREVVLQGSHVSFQQILLQSFQYLIYYVFFAAALQQIMVNFFEGSYGFVTTLQIRCYVMAIQCLCFVPFVGILLTEIVILIISTRGFQLVQKLPFNRAVLVSSVPLMYFLLGTFASIARVV